MSRLLITCSLLTALASSAFGAGHFAQPPHANTQRQVEPASDRYEPDLRVAPRRALDRDTVRAALLQARQTNLLAFRAYQKGGVFPSNTFKGKKLNVWRDEDGHYCAAATIIKMSGQDDLVARVADQSNFIRLADVRQGPLMDWILTSGFTQDEIAMIQEPFEPVMRPEAPRPNRVVTVDPELRTAENARLLAVYKQVDKSLVKNQKQNLELAVDRLMAHQQLAWNLINTQLGDVAL